MSEPVPATDLEAPPPAVGSARAQLLASYFATGSKTLAWAVAAAAAYRLCGPGPFAFLMLLRGTLAIFNYTSFGLGPAVLHYILRCQRAMGRAVEAVPVEEGLADSGPVTLDYSPKTELQAIDIGPGSTPASVLLHAGVLTGGFALLAFFALGAYTENLRQLHAIPRDVIPRELGAAWLLGLGVICRIAGDVAGGALHARGRLVLDQTLVAAGELAWALLCVSLFWKGSFAFIDEIARPYFWTGAAIALARWVAAVALVGPEGTFRLRLRKPEIRLRHSMSLRFHARLLAFGGLVTLASLGDFLYAPIDYVILNSLVSPLSIAIYAPAVQVDAAVILLVTAIAAVILPRAAMRHAAGDRAGVWREYVRASLGAAGIALAASLTLWALSPWLFNLWLGNDLPETRRILPWVLLHTVIGSAGGVGRSTFLAVGRPGTYAASTLLGGLLNITLSLLFVYTGLGLFGVVLGTILSVALRCALWMPWYLRRLLKYPPQKTSDIPN